MLKKAMKLFERAITPITHGPALEKSQRPQDEGLHPSPSSRGEWVEADGPLHRRKYDSYSDYLGHQKAKLATVDLVEYHQRFRHVLRERVTALKLLAPGDTVLCLGARIGTECQAFLDMGCFAVGIDLNPGPSNKYVLVGDFHALQFSPRSVRCIYTNALDHSYELEQVLREVKRVLIPGGLFMADIIRGSRDVDGRGPGEYESYWWDSLDDVIRMIESKGFNLVQRHRFTYPWSGDQVVFQGATD